MGSWYRSFSLRGDERTALTALLDRWLLAKGFERVAADEGPHLLPPDPRGERGAFLLANTEWTVLVYSEIGEEDRLALELTRLGKPTLRFYVVDSDVWAYELRDDSEVVSAFVSKTGMYGDLPDGPNDLPAFVKTLGIANDPANLARLQRRRAIMAEQPAEEFLAAIGVRAAASQFEYVLENEVEAPGFAKLELRYRRPGFDPLIGFDLHRIEPRTDSEPPPSAEEARRMLAEHLGAPRAAAFLALGKVLGTLLHVLFWFAKPLLLWKMRKHGRSAEGPEGAPRIAPIGGATLTGGDLQVPFLGFRLSLPEGADGPRGRSLFRWNGVDVSVRVDPPERVRMVLSAARGGERLLSRNLFFGALPAKAVVFERKGRDEAVYRSLVLYVTTGRGIYSFHAGAPHDQPQPSLEQLEELIAPLSTFELTHIAVEEMAQR